MPKYSTSSWKCRKPSRTRSTPTAFSARMRSAICCGVPIKVRAEAVVVLNEILEGRFRPVAFALGRGLAGVLDLVAEGVDRFRVRLFDDFRQDLLGFLLGLARDREGVDADLARCGRLRRLFADVVDLLLDSFDACCRW